MKKKSSKLNPNLFISFDILVYTDNMMLNHRAGEMLFSLDTNSYFKPLDGSGLELVKGLLEARKVPEIKRSKTINPF